MTTLNIGGQRVKVDDKFVTLAPEQQQAIVEQIASQLADRLGPSRAERRAALVASNPAEFDPASPEFQAKYGATAGMGTIDKFRSGFGKAFVDLGRGARQLYASAADFVDPRERTVADVVAGRDPSRSAALQREAALARERDAPLMETKAGLAGNIAGNVAATIPTIAIPGAATIRGAALTGAAFGALQPTTSDGERIANTVFGGAAGAAGQKLFNVAGKAITRYIGNRRFAPGIRESAVLRERLVNDLRAAGASEDDIVAAVQAADARVAEMTANPEATTRAAQAKQLGVDLTPGQAEQSITKQGREFALARGTEGEGASLVAREGFERQQGQLADAADAIRGRFGGQVNERGQGAAIVADRIRDSSKAAKSVVNDAYDAARAADAFSNPASVRGLRDTSRAALIDEGFDIGAMPQVMNRLDELDKLQNFAAMAAQKGRTKAQIPLRELEQWRKRINANISRNADQPQDVALMRMRESYDNWIADQLDRDLLSGAPEALDLWKNARSMRTRYGQLFESERAIKDIIRKDPTPEQMKNWLIGASSVGAKAEAGRVAEKVAQIVGRDSPAWRAMQEEVYVDLLSNQPASGFSAQKFVTAFDRFVTKNPTLVKTLFSKEDLAAIKRLRDVAEMTIPLPGAVNTSNTTYALLRELRPKAAALIEKLTPFLERIKHALSEVEARKVFGEGYQPQPKLLMFTPKPVGAPAVAAGAALIEPGE